MATTVSAWEHLVGATITSESLPPAYQPEQPRLGEYVRVTALGPSDDVRAPDAPGIVIVEIDGAVQYWATDDPDSVQVVTAQPSCLARAAEVARHDGPMTLYAAMRHIEIADARWRASVGSVPARQQRARQVREALAASEPDLPPVMSSRYTRARVRRIDADRWAADIGHAGSLRPLGEHDSADAAHAAVRQAHEQAWQTLRSWLARHVAGIWTLTYEPLVVIEEDRLSGPAVARILGIESGTWRGYVSRGQAPAPDGHSGDGRPYWTLATLQSWQRPGQGARTDLQPGSSDDNA
ncbi:hypothetical protein KIH74_22770 [Kineosporia sp. J2-2]|uniref:Uncharacterized protein n=1 Tax=Kineosporia corallincola TaxID=2835133 RepID=A0ABS5TL02_9ACTN|nr:hypothetical protein [Kineosporia corallincola]MBT0771782.1 hypothetical protein [Kineosporia corallincola]